MRILNSIFSAAALLALTACHHPLHDFTAKTVKLEVDQLKSDNPVVGRLDFVRYTQEPYEEQVCETYICGYDRDYRCHMEPRCGYVNGHRACEGSHEVCEWVETPRYCERDCHWETRYRTLKHVYTSRLFARVQGLSADAIIEELALGIETNEKFQSALRNPGERPKEYKELFERLRPTDRTLLAMKAKGAELVPNDSFVRLPENFRLGDDIQINVKVRDTRDTSTRASIIGTSNRIPF